jgi:NAD(P)-dependent dehydrogenase (short-subunit alcohol dehydrogenase family)
MENRAYLESVRDRLPGYQLAVEFGNKMWMETQRDQDRTLRFLRDQGLAFVNLDMPQGYKSSLPATAEVTDPKLAMVRFHGRDPEAWTKKTVQERFRYRYKPQELQDAMGAGMQFVTQHAPSPKRAVVTGATGGIGEAISRRLAAEGMTVVMVGRDDARLAQAAQRIRAAVPAADLQLERADLSSLAQVRHLVERLGREPLPDVVVSNAAVIAGVREVTPEGLQKTLATNHLAPYLLLRSLVHPLGNRPARFVVVGGQPRALSRIPVDLDDLGFEDESRLGSLRDLRPFVAYGKTKNMNAMFVYALARRLEGTNITVNGAHPGIIRGTGLGRNDRGALRAFGRLMNASPFLPGPEVGADTPAWLASSPEVEGVTGRFFVRRRQVPTAPHTTDPARCDRLWDLSARLVGLSGHLATRT